MTESIEYPITLTPPKQVYRGDALRFGVSMQAGNPLADVDLFLFGTAWTAQARASTSSGDAAVITFAVDITTGVVSGKLLTIYLSLTGAQTAAIPFGELGFDIEASGGALSPITPFTGRLVVTGEYA